MYEETKMYINYFTNEIDYVKKIIQQAKKLKKNYDDESETLDYLHKKLERKNIILNYMDNIINNNKMVCV
jgi:hypothetical protein